MDRSIDICTLPRMPEPLSKQKKIEEFWKERKDEIDDIEDFGDRALPVARIKKVLCAEKGTMMMTCDTPSFVTKACEIFVQEFAFRAWKCAESHQRHVILDSDIAEAIFSTESYDFLKDVLHTCREVQNSISDTKPARKRHRLNQPSTSHPLSCQVPMFNPTLNGYSLYDHTPVAMPPKHLHPNPLGFEFLVQDGCSLMETTFTSTPTTKLPNSYMRRDSMFFGNNFNTTTSSNFFTRNFVPYNNVVPSNSMTPLQIYQGPMPNNIPANTFSVVNMAKASSVTDGVLDADIDNIPVQNWGGGIESNDILSGVVTTESLIPTCSTITSLHGINFDTTISVEEGLHQQQEEKATIDLHRDGKLERIIATGTSESGGIRSDSFDGFEMADGSWLTEFWSNIMIDEPSTLIEPLSTNVEQKLEGINQDGVTNSSP